MTTQARPGEQKGFGRRPTLLAWPTRAGWFLAILTILELAWLAWFLVEPLPSFPREKGTLRRWQLAAKAIPEVVPGTTFRQSLLGQALLELSHLENLQERLPVVACAALIAVAALGLGELVLAALRLRAGMRLAERLALDFGLGTAGLGVLTLLAGRAGLLHPWLFRALLMLIALAGAGVSRFWQTARPRLEARWLFPALLVAPVLVIMFLGAMLPSIDFDVLEYHLQGPKEYYQAGRIAYLPHNVYTSMPFGVEMLHLLGMEILGDWWWGGLVGQLMVALFAPMSAILIGHVAGRSGSRQAGWLAAIVYLSTPWVYRLAVIAYVEGPLCYYHAALIWAVSWGWNDRAIPRGAFWGLMGLLAGGAMACKYPALISAAIPFGLLALWDCQRSRSSLPLVAYALGWAIIMTPWLARNLIDTGNPVYPLGYHVFGGRYWDASREARWFQVHGPFQPSLADFGNSLIDVAGRSDWQSALYVAFAPLAFCRRGSRKTVFAVSGYAAYLFVTWWFLTHRLDRFWLPLLPSLAVLAGLGADWTEGLLWRILRGSLLGFSIFCNFVDCTTALTGLNEWTGSLTILRQDVPRRLNPPLAAIDRELPAGAKILLVGSAAVYHVNHAILYNTVFTPETIEQLAAGKTASAFRQALRDRGVTHVYVDWKEIRRYREPGNYGFTDYVTPERFAEWVRSGVLHRPLAIGSEQELYAVK